MLPVPIDLTPIKFENPVGLLFDSIPYILGILLDTCPFKGIKVFVNLLKFPTLNSLSFESSFFGPKTYVILIAGYLIYYGIARFRA